MASKTKITNVTIETKFNTAYVYYDSGSEKMYPADKLPKTVAKWLADHEVDSITSVNAHDDGSLVAHYATGTTKAFESLDDLPKEIKTWVNTNGVTYNAVAETVEDEPETVEEKLYFLASYEHSNGVWCTNLVHALNEIDAWNHIMNVHGPACGCTTRKAADYEVEAYKDRGCPVVEAPHIENPEPNQMIDVDDTEHEAVEKASETVEADEPERSDPEPETIIIDLDDDDQTRYLDLMPAEPTQTHREHPRRCLMAQPKSLSLDIVDAVVSGLLMASQLSLIALAYLLMGLASTCQAIGEAVEWLTPRVAVLIQDAQTAWSDRIVPAGKAAAVWMAETVWFILI